MKAINPLDVKYLWERLLDQLSPVERTIIHVLGDQPLRIKEIAGATHVPASNVSVYLGRLVKKKLIDVRASGRRMVYRLCPELIPLKELSESVSFPKAS